VLLPLPDRLCSCRHLHMKRSGGGTRGRWQVLRRLERWLCTEIDDEIGVAASRSRSCFSGGWHCVYLQATALQLASYRHDPATGAICNVSGRALVFRGSTYYQQQLRPRLYCLCYTWDITGQVVHDDVSACLKC
jgi:hypothetical protein